MTDSYHTRRAGRFVSWQQLSDPDVDQSRRFLAEALAQLLSDLLRSILTNSSPAIGAGGAMTARYRELAAACGAGENMHTINASISRSSLAKRCVAWLKLLLAEAPSETAPAAAMRDFVDALGLFPALFDSDPAARSRRARLTWLLTHDRRLDASTREAATALIDACEHLAVLLWPDNEAV